MGLDRIELGCLVRWPSGAALWAKLDQAKEQAQEEGKPVLLPWWGCCLVHPNGKRAGGEGGPVYRWRLELGGCNVFIMRRDEPFGQTPNVQVEFGAVACMELRSTVEMQRHAQWQLASLGRWAGIEVQFIEWKLSRVDVRADLLGVQVAEFVEAINGQRYVARPREWSIHGSGLASSGFSLGRGNVLRVYDKLREMRQSEDTVKGALLAEQWGCLTNDGEWALPESVVRVEWQIRREMLKELGASSPAEFQEKRAAIMAYLSGEWVRLTEEVPDRANTSRAATWSRWQAVQRALQEWAGGPAEPAKRDRRVQVLPRGLERQAVGCLVNMAVAAEVDLEDELELEKWTAGQVRTAVRFAGEKLFKKYQHRCERHRAASVWD